MMNYLSSMLLVLLVGAVILMMGIAWMNKESELSPYGFHSAPREGLVWGGSFFFSFGAEFWALATIF